MTVGIRDPNIRGSAHLGILLERQHNFGSTIPPSSDVFGHETSFGSRGFRSLNRAGESEITDFEVTVGVEQQVGWFKISMDNIGGV